MRRKNPSVLAGKPYILAALIALLGIISFSPTLKTGFLWDDHEMIEKNPHIRAFSMENLKHAFTHDVFDNKGNAYFRPFQTIMNMFDYRIWGLNPVGYHITNLCFHLFGAIFLFLFLRRWMGDTRLSFLTASFFAVHPIIIEQLLIVAGRAEIMSGTFILAALYTSSLKNRMSPFLAPLLFILACLSKESGIIFPAFLVLIGFASPKLKTKVRMYAIYASLIVIYLLLRSKAVPSAIPLPGIKETLVFLFLEFPQMLGTYIQLLLAPWNLTSHRFFIFNGWYFLMSTTAIALFIFIGIRKKSKILILSIIWILIGLAPKMPLLATNALMLDHWFYLSSIGFFLSLSNGLLHTGKRSKSWHTRPLILAGLMAGFWIGLSWWNGAQRNTDEKLYRWALRFPTSKHVMANLGGHCYLQDRYEEAEKWLMESLKRQPGAPLPSNTLALVYWKTGRKGEALRLLDMLIEERPDYLSSWVNRATINRNKKSLDDLNYVLSLNPKHETALSLRADIQFQSDDLDGAIQSLQTLLKLNPSSLEARVNLGTVYAKKGDYKSAGIHWSKAMELDPDNQILINKMNWLNKKTTGNHE